MNSAARELLSSTAELAPVLARLIVKAAAGDRAATTKLLARIRPIVVRFCRRRLARFESATVSVDDVVQEVCLAVISALRNYDTKGLSFPAFVYGIAARKVIDAVRAASRDRTEPVAELPDAAADDQSPDEMFVDTLRVLRRDHQEYVTAVAASLDLDGGFADTWRVQGQRGYVEGLAARIDVDAGLATALDRITPPPRDR